MIYFIVLHYYLAINFKGTELAILVIFAEFVWGGGPVFSMKTTFSWYTSEHHSCRHWTENFRTCFKSHVSSI